MPQREQDPRIYFAAERTFLAWVRTGLALMGFGFVVARFGIFLRELDVAQKTEVLHPSGFSVWTGTALVLAGVIFNVVSTVEYLRTLRALNNGTYVPGKSIAAAVSVSTALAVVGLGMAVYLFFIR